MRNSTLTLLMLLSLAYAVGCNKREKKEAIQTKIDATAKKYSLSLDPPFESSNECGEDNHTHIGFMLTDSAGNFIKPFRDTVTKTGPHLDYDTLPEGLYYYKMQTAFGEYRVGKLSLDHKTYESISLDDVYHYSDSLPEKKILEADSIKIVYAENDDGPFHIFSFYKTKESNYKCMYSVLGERFWCFILQRKSSSLKTRDDIIPLIMNFYSKISGLEKDGVEEDYGDEPEWYYSNKFYIKADTVFYYTTHVNNKYFKDAYAKFKASFF